MSAADVDDLVMDEREQDMGMGVPLALRSCMLCECPLSL